MQILFFNNNDGENEVLELMSTLRAKSPSDKNSRIQLRKIIAYFNLLSKYGTRIGEPVTKHISGDIWELRPLKNRIMYAVVTDNKCVVLTCFEKKSRKLPKKELIRAQALYVKYLEEVNKDENMGRGL